MGNKSDIIELISIRTGISSKKIEETISSSKCEYSVVHAKIKKKKRIFYIPSPQLKIIQLHLIKIVLEGFEVSSHAHAYIKNKSIKTNVNCHIGNTFFFQTDIKSFFPSIKANHIKNVLSKDDSISKDDIGLILSAVVPFESLDLGSPTSPIISNIIMLEFDQKIESLIQENYKGAIYTRYSDDITISSKQPILGIDKIVDKTLEEFGFEINKSKTKYTQLIDKVKITGIFLHADKRMTVGTNFKRNLKQQLYLLSNGLDPQIDNIQIMGMLSYIRDIEPEYYLSLVQKYSSSTKSIIDIIKSGM
ncbi:reverse transcriptase domain-containing protein [Erysipelothrix sp. strain 2 (EsS2-7-Brazil)]|uniref:reverse transcriptase domain-containing protein n=1 Tax=Erysipelothrix sp. strain 2 (EsS2-7-Brazil) TaxID=2500579 RepID=UPI00190B36A1|nr:reverse transcriptase domain-containing protein [Erysipelothrix sp. strain 2 (EsS2-7-Brazil)]